MDFDVIPYDDIKGSWKTLGSGSFGKVYKGTYLGIDVAIKEVLPSKDYDVSKYFEREWRLMKEARHPNVVLYLGLSKAPNGTIYIISEFIENGNLRIYIHDKNKPFPWRLRLSFATDITRALAYLHARKCIHRDLKGENLLITSNGRLKITDFGFARIAAQNAEESKRLTFCGTDSYMSPEISQGEQFGLETDIFSLGVIFCEVLARKLADDYTFKRTAPSFGIDASEVKRLASKGCPPDFITLALECCAVEQSKRPTTAAILARLRAIEMEVLSRESEEDLHIGSVKFLSGKGNKRPGAAPRIPSFGVGVGKDIRVGKNVGDNSIVDHLAESSDESEDDLVEALDGLQSVSIAGDAGHGPRVLQSSSTLYDHLRSDHHGQIPTEDSDWEAGNPLIATQKESSEDSTYTTTATVIRHPSPTTTGPPGLPPPAMSSVMTIKASPPRVSGAAPTTPRTPPPTRPPPSPPVTPDVLQHHKHMSSEGSNPSIMSYHTAVSSSLLSGPSIAAATEGSTMSTQSSGAIHRFTLHKLGKKQSVTGIDSLLEGSPSNGIRSWSPFEFFFGNALGTGGKCDLCGKRLGWKPSLECDDCGLRAHPKCGESAPRDCGLRVGRTVPETSDPSTPDAASRSPSPKARQKSS